MNCLSKTKAFGNGRLKDHSSSASKHLFLLEKNLSIAALDGMAVLYHKNKSF